ncbi:hypothetical protein RM530_00365 [Algiphilus sp. W345]|uniref:GAD-related domain-containing protein n=1 Tax=Banduia mediterranea TaxID=3075609 RepID=A0ABU2WFF3_9GAMM|nr:hypothetical protein [Algiphilus sp. W345]MDT0495822.1 hypothetical protein [Algiphilus sp. W345]
MIAQTFRQLQGDPEHDVDFPRLVADWLHDEPEILREFPADAYGDLMRKATSGLCQPIVAMMPPHDTYMARMFPAPRAPLGTLRQLTGARPS